MHLDWARVATHKQKLIFNLQVLGAILDDVASDTFKIFGCGVGESAGDNVNKF